jgi:hypothetical protein
MKRLIIVLSFLFVFSISAYAQTGMMGSQQGKMGEGMMGEGKQKPMMNYSRMRQMYGQRMMIRDMMQMMMDIMNIQEKIIKGADAAEKKKMMKDLTQMKEKMQEMMSMQKGMKGGKMKEPTPIPSKEPESKEKEETQPSKDNPQTH